MNEHRDKLENNKENSSDRWRFWDERHLRDYIDHICSSKVKPLLLSAKDSAKLLGIGRTLFYSMHSSGRLGPLPIRLGRRVLWNRRELEAWVEAGRPNRHRWLDVENKKNRITN